MEQKKLETLRERLQILHDKIIDNTKILSRDPHNGQIETELGKLEVLYNQIYEKILLEEDEKFNKKSDSNDSEKVNFVFKSEADTLKEQILDSFPEQSAGEKIILKHSLRSEVETQRLLSKMSSKDLIYNVESVLSTHEELWEKLSFPKPFPSISYTQYYFELYAQEYENIIRLKTEGLFSENMVLKVKRIRFLNAILLEILNNYTACALSNRVDTLQDFTSQIIAELIGWHDSDSNNNRLTTLLNKKTEVLIEELRNIANKASFYSDN